MKPVTKRVIHSVTVLQAPTVRTTDLNKETVLHVVKPCELAVQQCSG